MQEKQIFIEDDEDDLTTEQKNQRLAEKLAGTHVSKLIVRIERIEIAAKGWRITYRTAT